MIFSSELAFNIRWPKYCSFSFGISPSKKCSELISSRIDLFYLFAGQGTLKSFFQIYSSKASVFRWSAYFMVQLSHPYMTTGKTIGLTIWTFVGKMMFLLFNTLSRFSVVFLPRCVCVCVCVCVRVCVYVCVLAAQSCPTLYDPKDYNPPVSSVHGILQTRKMEWVAIPTPGDIPDLEIEPRSLTLQANYLPSEPPGKTSIF